MSKLDPRIPWDSKGGYYPLVHICWPWRYECGNTFRIYLNTRWLEVNVALTPNSTFGRIDSDGKITDHWILVGRNPK